MRNDIVYLKQQAGMEPLFNQWYAWSYLLSPATSAMYVTNSHLKIMQSFVNAPQVHVSALKNPAMLGGPFINYEVSKVDEIKNLIGRTVKENEQVLAFAEAVKTLDNILTGEASGFSLEPLYQKVPEVLKGYIELVYDLNNRPAIRFIEALLYRSPYYKESSQSVSLFLSQRDTRTFVFSTPRLLTSDQLHLTIPFKHSGIDELFQMRQRPQSFGHISEVLGIKPEGEFFRCFFTEDEPEPCHGFAGDGVRVRYFGHACVLIETKDVSVLVDPVICYGNDGTYSCYTYADLPETIDYVLITHNHQDHCMFESLLQLRHKVRTVVLPKNNGGGLADPSLKLLFQILGFSDVREIDEMEEIKIKDGTITGLPFLGEHADLNIRTKIAYWISLKGRSVLCLADSNNIETKLYQHISNWFRGLDILLLGMECDGAPMSWLYGPLMTNALVRKMDQTRRFDGSNCEKGLAIVDILRPQEVYVYAMGQEPWLTYLTSIQYTDESRPIIESNKLVTECRHRGINSERLFCQKEILLDPH
ncbi:MAG: MBL fold metallo-hydrolase [Acidobacteriota bacterium]